MSNPVSILAKDDLVAMSKHADASFMNDDGFTLFWFDTPKKGKCLSVGYSRQDFPTVIVIIGANWKARRHIARYLRWTRKGLWNKGPF